MSKANPDNLKALAKKFGLKIVWISSVLNPDNEHYMLVHMPAKDGTKAAIFQLADGSFTSNREIPDIAMTKLPVQNQAKKFRIEI